jgi:hypothetical protein
MPDCLEYRNANTGLESKALLLLNLTSAFALVMGLFLLFERMRDPRLPSLRSKPPGTIKRWIVVMGLLCLYAHLNAHGFWTDAGYSRGFPFAVRVPHGFRAWAAVLDFLIGVGLFVGALRYFPSTRRGNVLAFTALYVLANFDSWRWVHLVLDTGGGYGFPFPFYHPASKLDVWLMASDVQPVYSWVFSYID